MNIQPMPIRHIVQQKARAAGIAPNDPVINLITGIVCDVLNSDEFALHLNRHIEDVCLMILNKKTP